MSKRLINTIGTVSIVSSALFSFNVQADTHSPSTQALTASKSQLMAKLAGIKHFSAQFSQSIYTEEGELIQQGAGKLAISKPNLVNWQTTSPDETFIISDGETLWFYDPFIDQATAYSLAKSIDNTPILLLTNDDTSLWQQYQVNKVASAKEQNAKSDVAFVITPKKEDSQIKSLTVTFNGNAIKSFSFKDATGQLSQIELTQYQQSKAPAEDLFQFTLPEGVRLEDKR